ncbi:MAG: hypothetical protein ACLQFI_11510 [Methylocella sp.]
MPKSPAADEWDQLEVKMGRLTIATGYLEVAIISMVCRILGKTEKEVGRFSNNDWCKKFIKHAPSLWSESARNDLSERLKEIRKLYERRNDLIHAALMTVSDGSIHGIPPGSIIDGRTYGFGCTKQDGNVFCIGLVAKRVHLDDIDRLFDDIRNARVGLVPFMELVDKIPEPAKSIRTLKVGKLLSECD